MNELKKNCRPKLLPCAYPSAARVVILVRDNSRIVWIASDWAYAKSPSIPRFGSDPAPSVNSTEEPPIAPPGPYRVVSQPYARLDSIWLSNPVSEFAAPAGNCVGKPAAS